MQKDDGMTHLDTNELVFVASKPVLWLLSTLFAALIFGGGYWMQSVYAQGKETHALAQDNRETITPLKGEMEAIKESQKRLESDMRAGFDRMERKLDSVIDRELRKDAHK